MRTILIMAAILIAAGTYMAQLADKMTSAQAKAAPVAVAMPASVQASGRSVIIPHDSRGHFQTDARIEGQHINFMIDTGASVVALTESDAERIGVRPSRNDYTATVSTANGPVKAARVRLASVNVGGLEIRDVDAMVLPNGSLSENLLGLSFLSRLKRFEFANGQMVLE
jgi:aspartyl protease family protein